MEEKRSGALGQEPHYLECEKKWAFLTLMFVGGFLGAFTYSIRGGVFCNAQTGNFVLLAMALGHKDWGQVLYLLVPITAYFSGAAISEALAGPIRKLRYLRWETLFIAVEMAVVAILGLIPEDAPYQITQVAVNFICSMQYATFHHAQGIPMATTFCTNHLRQIGLFFTRAIRHRSEAEARRMAAHMAMIFVFVLGGMVSCVLCDRFQGKAVWGALIPLGALLIDFLCMEWQERRNSTDTGAR